MLNQQYHIIDCNGLPRANERLLIQQLIKKMRNEIKVKPLKPLKAKVVAVVQQHSASCNQYHQKRKTNKV